MERSRGFGAAVCRTCGTAWSSRSARFCGHCGAALDATDPSRAEVGRDTAARGPGRGRDRSDGETDGAARRRIVGIVLAAALLAAVSIAAVTGDSLWEPDPLVEDPEGVELPDPEDVEDGGPEPEPADPGAATDGASRTQTVCEPDDCALWGIPDPPASAMVLGTTLVMSARGGGLEQLGEGLGEGEELRIQGFSLLDGLPVWETGLDAPPPEDGVIGPSIHPVGEDHALIATGGSVALLDATDGSLQWLVDLDHVVGYGGLLDEDHLFVIGEPHRGAHPGAPGGGAFPGASDQHDVGDGVTTPEVNTLVLDRATGEPVWTADGRRVVTADGYARVEAWDTASGDLAWDREHEPDPRRALLAIDGGRVVLFPRGGLQVVDAQDGELLAGLDIDLSGDPNVQVVGDLVIVSESTPSGVAEPPSRTGMLFDLREPGAEPEPLEGLVQAIPLTPAHDPFAPWTRPQPTGVALAFQEDERFEIRVLEPDGTIRWAEDGVFEEPSCCVRVHPGGDGRMLVVAPSLEIGPPTIVSTDDGSPIAAIELPDDLDPSEPLHFFGDLVVAQDGVGDAIVLAGEAGYVRVNHGAPRFAGPPVPLIHARQGLLGIDPTLLFDEDLRREGGWHDGE
jgi:hypothetical protein